MDELGLNELVERYGKTDTEIKALKRINEQDKESIKNLLADSDTQKWSYGGFTVTRVVSNSETLNEGKLMALMQSHRDLVDANEIIKTREYIDMEALESAIYSGKLPKEFVQEMDSCREVKTTVSLRCAKTKAKEEQ